MNRKGLFVCILFTLMLSVIAASCGKADLKGNNSKGTTTTTTAGAKVGTEQGDGTIAVTLYLTNPESGQDKYNLIFAPPSSIEVGKPLHGFKSYEVNAGAEVNVSIMDFYSYFEMDASGNFTVGLTAARLEDVNVRNPLSETMILTFPNMQTCSEGDKITLNITDKPLTSLYPEGTFLVRIVDPLKEGGYVDFLYKSQTNATLKYGSGSSGPDFLVAFDAAEFKKKGIRDAILVISNSSNQHISEQVELSFDENGYCKQGQYIEIEVIR